MEQKKKIIGITGGVGAGKSAILEYIAELKDSKTVLVAYNTNDPDAGMSNTRDLSRFKLFLSDTGLFVTLMFKDKDFTENEIYEKIQNSRLQQRNKRKLRKNACDTLSNML